VPKKFADISTITTVPALSADIDLAIFGHRFADDDADADADDDSV
jgi:hypothetical protein